MELTPCGIFATSVGATLVILCTLPFYWRTYEKIFKKFWQALTLSLPFNRTKHSSVRWMLRMACFILLIGCNGIIYSIIAKHPIKIVACHDKIAEPKTALLDCHCK